MNNFSLSHSKEDISVSPLESSSEIRPKTIWSIISGTVLIDTIIPPTKGQHMLILQFLTPQAATDQISANGNVNVAIRADETAPVMLFYNPVTRKYYGGTPDPSE